MPLVQNNLLKHGDRDTDHIPKLNTFFSAPVGLNMNMSLHFLLYHSQAVHMKTYKAFQCRIIIKGPFETKNAAWTMCLS